jgi:chromosome segregation ATPase
MLPFAKASTLRESQANVEHLTTQITELQNKLSTSSQSVTDLTDRATKAESDLTSSSEKVTKLEADLTSANDKVTKLETEVSDAKSQLEGFDGRVKSEAVKIANSHLAGLGHKPIDGDSSNSSTPGSSNSLSEDEFWSSYRSQKPSSKAKWYAENKHLIGR